VNLEYPFVPKECGEVRVILSAMNLMMAKCEVATLFTSDERICQWVNAFIFVRTRSTSPSLRHIVTQATPILWITGINAQTALVIRFIDYMCFPKAPCVHQTLNNRRKDIDDW
jgi:hypothetical protein